MLTSDYFEERIAFEKRTQIFALNANDEEGAKKAEIRLKDYEAQYQAWRDREQKKRMHEAMKCERRSAS